MPSARKIVFYGCPLDSDERQESIDEKLAQGGVGHGLDDPYDAVLALIRDEADAGLFQEAGCLETPEWLRPIPPAAELPNLVVDNFVRFIDGEGCRACAEALGQMAVERILPDLPVMVTVDHSLTGGVYARLAREYGPENLSLVVLDSHLDALPAPIMAGAIAYDMETNPNSLYDPHDPFLKDRPDSFNASSFLHHLLQQGDLSPRNLYVIGMGDYPPKRSLRVKDPRVRAYTGIYTGLKRRGARLVSKADLAKGAAKLKVLLKQIKTLWVYISVDLDVGARNAVEGVRFTNRLGLSRTQIMGAARALADMLATGPRLAGLDCCEFNPRPRDPEVYRLAADLIKILCFQSG